MTSLLIDSHGVGYAAHYAIRGLLHDGSETGIPFGFFWSILNLAEQFKTNRFIFCWDGGAKGRKQIFPEYKISRKPTTEKEREEKKGIHIQFDAMRKDILPSVGFKNIVQQYGYESDDLIAKIIDENPDKRFVIVSQDHDLFQLLRYKNCSMMVSPNGRKKTTASSFALEYGIPAREWSLVKAIAGCDSDGVPGIPGVGIKTAIKYLNRQIDPIKTVSRRIETSGEYINRNFKLVYLPFPGAKVPEIQEEKFDQDKLFQMFDDLGFESFLKGDERDRWELFCRGYEKMR